MVVQTRLVYEVATGAVSNRILVDEAFDYVQWSLGDGLALAPASVQGAIGGTYIDGVYTAPPKPPAKPEE